MKTTTKKAPEIRGLCNTWLQSELAGGKTQQQAMEDLNRATGYKADYVQVLRWRNGERSPRPVVREYMLRLAIPHVIGGLTKSQVSALVDALV